MTSITKSALVPFSAQDMYELVSDIEAYPKFLPWCGGTNIIEKSGESVTASIAIAYKGVNKSFTTRNRLQPGRVMEMQLVDGPFKALHGYWTFDALDETACKVTLDLEFEFSSMLVSMALGPVFESIANNLVDQFQKRAHEIYGKRS
ncbi:MAG: type II toxin-antitoxin system RatA family toxin [Gammaproteobacteria bacterium]|nr:type II toxin-antitoxin system RatA family toxin [Gammaproteobacteria bacterium]